MAQLKSMEDGEKLEQAAPTSELAIEPPSQQRKRSNLRKEVSKLAKGQVCYPGGGPQEAAPLSRRPGDCMLSRRPEGHWLSRGHGRCMFGACAHAVCYG